MAVEWGLLMPKLKSGRSVLISASPIPDQINYGVDVGALAVFVAFLLAICASTANAEWKFVYENPEGDMRWFLDTSRFGWDDTSVWAWILIDHKERQTSDSGSYHSIELLEEINCVTREESFYSYIYSAERMGRGKVIDSDTFGGAGPITFPPDTPAEKLVNAACDEFLRRYKPEEIKEARWVTR